MKTRHYAQRPTITRATYPALPASKPIGSHPQTGTLATSVTNALIVQSEVAGNGILTRAQREALHNLYRRETDFPQAHVGTVGDIR